MILKGAKVTKLELDAKELNKINKHTLEPLAVEDVFVYKTVMCDNAVDRSYEYFPIKALKKMKQLFIGKTMIKDHKRSADNQVARIYDTELVMSDSEQTKQGEPYTQLVAHCYMLVTDANKDLIAEIKAGIKKEVSVGLRIGKAVCSICQTDNMQAYCEHWAGKDYDGVACIFSLEDPTDAYELSFVAVPAQPRAGTTKAYGEQVSTYSDEEQTKQLKNDGVSMLGLKMKALDTFLFTQNSKQKEHENE